MYDSQEVSTPTQKAGFGAPSTTPVNERNEWRTPEMLVNYCRDLLGGLDYDTACTLANAVARPVWFGDGLVGQGNAFSRVWTGRCFCNPPLRQHYTVGR